MGSLHACQRVVGLGSDGGSSLPAASATEDDAATFVIVVGYNVAAVLPRTVAAIPSPFRPRTLLVDDGSNDGTGEIGRRLGLTVIAHPRNLGYGAAQKTGFIAALARGATIVVLVHGDNQYDPTLIPVFAATVGRCGCDVVTGTRMVTGDALRNGMPFWKFLANHALTRAGNWVFRTAFTDLHDGYRAYSSRFLQQVPFEQMSDRFDFDAEMLAHAAERGVRIAEVPHPARYEAENSQMSFATALSYGFRLCRLMLRHRGRRRAARAAIG
jgi:glycosyltransferase involved in cell wall biosynthesis